jgi:hypothetical protein
VLSLHPQGTCSSMVQSSLAACGLDAFSVAVVGPGFVHVGSSCHVNRLRQSLLTPARVLSSCRTISLLLAVGPDACGTGVSVGLCGLA